MEAGGWEEVYDGSGGGKDEDVPSSLRLIGKDWLR